jgi:hypothetical protein
VTTQHLLTFLEEDKILQELSRKGTGKDSSGMDEIKNMVPGFFRYEHNPAEWSGELLGNHAEKDGSVWVNFNTEGGALPPFVILGGQPYFSCKPPVWCYSGGMMATQAHLHRFLQSPTFFGRTMGCPTQVRETAAEELYCTDRTDFMKVIPMRRIERMMIHHQPNKDMSKPECQKGGAKSKECDGFIRWLDIKPEVESFATQIEEQFGGK